MPEPERTWRGVAFRALAPVPVPEPERPTGETAAEESDAEVLADCDCDCDADERRRRSRRGVSRVSIRDALVSSAPGAAPAPERTRVGRRWFESSDPRLPSRAAREAPEQAHPGAQLARCSGRSLTTASASSASDSPPEGLQRDREDCMRAAGGRRLSAATCWRQMRSSAARQRQCLQVFDTRTRLIGSRYEKIFVTIYANRRYTRVLRNEHFTFRMYKVQYSRRISSYHLITNIQQTKKARKIMKLPRQYGENVKFREK